MESWLLGTHVQCSEVERIQTSEPETGSSTCPSCHSLFLCLRKIQPLSPRLRFPFIKCGTVEQMRGNVSKNYLVQCLAHSKCLIKNSHYFMAYWIFDHSSTFSTFGQLPESSPVRRLDFSEGEELSRFPRRLHWLFHTLSWHSSFSFFPPLGGGNSRPFATCGLVLENTVLPGRFHCLKTECLITIIFLKLLLPNVWL